MEYDKKLRESAELMIKEQSGSVSLLQRRFSIGYNWAGRIIDQLESLNIVGAFEGAKARKLKVKSIKELNKILKPLNL
jgi:S-DNA-T family DNA segregation ATPase FtsK/SpoIIIE